MRLGTHFHEGSVLTIKNTYLSTKKIYDKNYRAVSLSTTCILL